MPDNATGIPCCAAWKKKQPRLFPCSRVCALYTPAEMSAGSTPVKELTVPVFPPNSTTWGYLVARIATSAWHVG